MTSRTAHLRGRPSGKCAKCGKHVPKLQLDHIDPLWHGGKNDTSNTQWLCDACHQRKTATELRSNAYREYRMRQDEEPKKGRGCCSTFLIILLLFLVVMVIRFN